MRLHPLILVTMIIVIAQVEKQQVTIQVSEVYNNIIITCILSVLVCEVCAEFKLLHCVHSLLDDVVWSCQSTDVLLYSCF